MNIHPPHHPFLFTSTALCPQLEPMASIANHLCAFISAKTSTKPSGSRPNNSSDLVFGVRFPEAVSLRSSFVSSSYSQLTRSVNSELSGSLSRPRSRICASSAQVIEQSASRAGSNVPTTVEVDLGNRSYPIYIGSGLLDQHELLQRYSYFQFCTFYNSGVFWFLIYVCDILYRNNFEDCQLDYYTLKFAE